MIELQNRYSEQGLRVLAFPCNQFGSQEPGSNDEIKAFAENKNVNFDMFSKIHVNGAGTHPLYIYLKHKQSGLFTNCLLYTSPSPRDGLLSRMPSSA